MVKNITEPTTIRHATEWMAWVLQTMVLSPCGCQRTVEDIYCITSGIYYTRLSEYYALPKEDQRLSVFNAMLLISILREKPCKKEHGEDVAEITIQETSFDGKEITVGLEESVEASLKESVEKSSQETIENKTENIKEKSKGKSESYGEGSASPTSDNKPKSKTNYSLIKEKLMKGGKHVKVKASDREGALIRAVSDYSDRMMAKGIDIYKPENIMKYNVSEKFRHLDSVVKPSVWAETTNKYNSLVRLYNSFPGDEYTEMTEKQVEVNNRIIELKKTLKEWNEIND